MRAKEFVFENKNINQDDKSSVTTFAIKKLPNSDFYKQYRFGVAIAAAQSQEQRKTEPAPTMSAETSMGENQIVVCYDEKTEDVINHALNIVGLSSSDKKLISTRGSYESTNTAVVSPVIAFKGYER